MDGEYNEILEGWEFGIGEMDPEEGYIEGYGDGGEPITGKTWIAVVVFHCIREGRSTIKIMEPKGNLAKSVTLIDLETGYETT
ncbi:MAG: hypothetical protein QW176_06150, partial [Candidatus Bathyarchaeia archaeon]